MPPSKRQKLKAAGGAVALVAGVTGLVASSLLSGQTVVAAAPASSSIGRTESCVLDAGSGCTLDHGFGEKPASITAQASGAGGPATVVINPANTTSTKWRISFWTHDGQRFPAGTAVTFYAHYDLAATPTPTLPPPTTAPPTFPPITPPSTTSPPPASSPTATATTPSVEPSTPPTTPAPTPTPEPLRPSWQTTGDPVLTFSDEFDDTAVDTQKWERGWFGDGITGPPNSNVVNCYDAKQVSESGGYLHLTAAQRQATCTIKGQSVTKQYVSGMVNSRLSFAQQYGAYEARVCNPDVNADGKVDNWSAWWLNGPWSVAWPEHGEIDIMEGLNGGSKTSVHYADAAKVAANAGSYTATPAVGCHTMGVQWTGDTATFYYDGKQVWTHAFNGPYPLWLILNYQLIDTQPVAVGSEVAVDWVRVWQ